MGVRLHADAIGTTVTMSAWLAEIGRPWAEQVRALFGDTADDVLAMILGDGEDAA